MVEIPILGNAFALCSNKNNNEFKYTKYIQICNKDLGSIISFISLNLTDTEL